MSKRRLVTATAIIALAAFVALLNNTNTVHAAPVGPFDLSIRSIPNTTAASGAINITTPLKFNVTSTSASQENFSLLIGIIPPDVTITPSSAFPIGSIVGSLLTKPHLGLIGAQCDKEPTVGFTLRNASTDPRDTISAMPQGTFNRTGNLRYDINPANGLPDYLDKYPSFLNELFDPDDSDVTGASPVFPLRPLARYAGDTNVLGTEVIIQFLIFGPGALTQFANTGANHPLKQLTDDFGYTSVTVLQDPTADAAPSTITDFCAPFTSTTLISATTDPEGDLITNQCLGDSTTETAATVAASGTADVEVDSTAGFPSSGKFQINRTTGTATDDLEIFSYTGLGTGPTSFTGITRAQLTSDEHEHSIGSGVSEALDDDVDGFINDGCVGDGIASGVRIGISEKDITGACDDAVDGVPGTPEDTPPDGIVNDGCPSFGAGPEKSAVLAPNCDPAAVDHDGDGFVNDGCPLAGSVMPFSPDTVGEFNMCENNTDDDDNNTANFGSIELDGFINDGCPQVGMAPETACADALDNDGDGFVNDGCPVEPTTGMINTEANGCLSGDTDDDDGDGSFNDGCPTVGSFTVAIGPPAGTGLFKTNTHRYGSFDLSIRDADGDGFENTFDTCPFVPNIDDSRATAGDDQAKSGGSIIARPDMIDPACDAAGGSGDNSTCGPLPAGAAEGGPADDDDNGDPLGQDCDLDGFLNSQDNCPQVANFGQTESERNVSFDLASTDGGTRTDGIGDACDVGAGAEDDPAACLNIFATADCGTVGACTNAVDDDGDGAINDGCTADGDPEKSECTGAGDGVDDDGDSTIDDGCRMFGDPVDGSLRYLPDGDPELQECSGGDATTTLTSSITGSATTIAVASTNGFPGPVPSASKASLLPLFAQVDTSPGSSADDLDIFSYTGKTATSFTGVTLGELSSGANSHASGAKVSLALDDDLDGKINDGCPIAGGSPTVADGAYSAVLNITAVCITDTAETVGVDTDGDGWCDETEQKTGETDFLGSCADDSSTSCETQGFLMGTDPEDSTPEHLAVDFDLPSTSAGATVNAPAISGVAQTCSDGIDNDLDGDIDGADSGCQAASSGKDDDADGVCDTAGAEASHCIEVASVDNCPGVKNPNQKNTDFDLNAAGYKVDDGGGTLVTLPADGLGDVCDIDDDNDSWTGNGSLSVGTVSTGGATSGVCRSTTDVPVFRDCIEQYLGTDQFDACPINANDDVWPVDIEPNGTIDVGDAGPGGFVDLRDDQDLRGDFNADLSVNLFDAFLLINTGPLGDTFGGNACSRT